MLDTNVFSGFMAGLEILAERLDDIRPGSILVPQPVIAEIAAGLARLPRSARERSLRRAFERVASVFPRSAWTDEVSLTYGAVKAQLHARGRVVEDFDIAIAAHALVEGATLATANVRHFQVIRGLQVENWLQEH